MHMCFAPFAADCSCARRTAIWVVLGVTLIVVSIVTASETGVAISCMLLTVLLVMIPWDGKRWYMLNQGAPPGAMESEVATSGVALSEQAS